MHITYAIHLIHQMIFITAYKYTVISNITLLHQMSRHSDRKEKLLTAM